MTLVAIYDACVLYPAPLRDLLLRVACEGAVRARWTEAILDECFRNLVLKRPDLSPSRLDRTRAFMNLAVRDALVTGYEPRIPGLRLPDPDDRHVLAAAIEGGAQRIVTFNRKDFPPAVLEPLGIETRDPDRFLVELFERSPEALTSAFQGQRRALKKPPVSSEQLLSTLARQGLGMTSELLRKSLDPVEG